MTDIRYRSINRLSELKPGDHIRVPPRGRGKSDKYGYTHHMLVVRVIDEKTIEVIHNTLECGVLQESLTYRPESITVLQYWSTHTGDQAVNRAKERIGDKYNLLTKNCEHVVFEVRKGKKESKQVKAAAAGGAVGGGAGVVGAGGAGVGIGALIGGAIGSIVPFGGTVAGAFLGGVIGGGIGAVVGGGGGATGGGFLNLRRINRKK